MTRTRVAIVSFQAVRAVGPRQYPPARRQYSRAVPAGRGRVSLGSGLGGSPATLGAAGRLSGSVEPEEAGLRDGTAAVAGEQPRRPRRGGRHGGGSGPRRGGFAPALLLFGPCRRPALGRGGRLRCGRRARGG